MREPVERLCVTPSLWGSAPAGALGHPALERQLGSRAAPSALFWLVVLAITIPKSRDCAADGQGGLYVPLCSSRAMEKGQKLVAVGWCEPVAKQGPSGLRLCWEHPRLLPRTFPWGIK